MTRNEWFVIYLDKNLVMRSALRTGQDALSVAREFYATEGSSLAEGNNRIRVVRGLNTVQYKQTTAIERVI